MPERIALALAAALSACAASPAPPADEPPPAPVTEERPQDDHPERGPGDPPSAPPPAYGHRVATRDLEQGPSGGLASELPDAAGTASTETPACVAFWPEVRFRNYANDHIVHLVSRCAVRVFCEVSSNVNPTAVQVELRPQEHVEVLTFRGSPAREFEPRVECRFRG